MDSQKKENDVIYLDIDQSSDLSMDENSEFEMIRSRILETEEECKKINKVIFGLDEQVARISSTETRRVTPEDKFQVDSRSVFVGNVDYAANVEEIEQHFKGCGPIKRVTIPCDKFQGNAKGFAYIEFVDKDSAKLAMAMDASLFRGRQIMVTSKRTNRPGISTTNRRPTRCMRSAIRSRSYRGGPGERMNGAGRVPFYNLGQPQSISCYRGGPPTRRSFRGRTWVRPT